MIRRWTSLVIAAAALMTTATAHSFGQGTVNIDIGTGWRQDSLHYSSHYDVYSVLSTISGAPVVTEVPNYNARTDYKDIRSWNFGGKAEYKECGVLLRVFGQYGDIYAGHSSVNEGTPTPTATVIHQYSAESDRGEVFDFGVAAGYPICFNLCCTDFTFTPIGGWSQSEQHFRQSKQQIFVDPSFPTAAQPTLVAGANIPKIYNSYQDRWNGWFVGYDLSVELPCTDVMVYTGFEWHFPRFLSRGQYNSATTTLINPLTGAPVAVVGQQQIDYSQKAWGNGFIVRAGGEYYINRCWTIGLLGFYSRYWVDNGYQDATIIVPAGAAHAKSVGNVRNLKWTSWAVMGSAGYQF